MTIPAHPKIYHIVHVDRLPSIIKDHCLWCDAEILQRTSPGTTIGMTGIKTRRLTELRFLISYPDLHVGNCVPFYFCPRSIMLYLIYQGNHPDLSYRDGQGPIVHLEADLAATVAWTETANQRWAFTLSNAGAYYFEDRCDLKHLDEINWEAVKADQWGGNNIDPSIKEGKQAEFLVEGSFPWHLIEKSACTLRESIVKSSIYYPKYGHRPVIEVIPNWYY